MGAYSCRFLQSKSAYGFAKPLLQPQVLLAVFMSIGALVLGNLLLVPCQFDGDDMPGGVSMETSELKREVGFGEA